MPVWVNFVLKTRSKCSVGFPRKFKRFGRGKIKARAKIRKRGERRGESQLGLDSNSWPLC